jgi:hypothetical protein
VGGPSDEPNVDSFESMHSSDKQWERDEGAYWSAQTGGQQGTPPESLTSLGGDGTDAVSRTHAPIDLDETLAQCGGFLMSSKWTVQGSRSPAAHLFGSSAPSDPDTSPESETSSETSSAPWYQDSAVGWDNIDLRDPQSIMSVPISIQHFENSVHQAVDIACGGGGGGERGENSSRRSRSPDHLNVASWQSLMGSYSLPSDRPALLLKASHPHQIVHANEQWLQGTSFHLEKVVGRTLEILKGPQTESSRMAELETKFQEASSGKGCVAVLTHYTRAGVPFRNTVLVTPVGTNTGLRAPHLLVCCSIEFATGTPLPSPRLRLLSNIPSLLFAGIPPYRVVDVNHTWLEVCKFRRQDVIGNTMSIIQGPRTEKDVVARLMKAVKQKKSFRGTITNYDALQRPLSNTLEVTPVQVLSVDKFYFLTTSHITHHPAPTRHRRHRKQLIHPNSRSAAIGAAAAAAVAAADADAGAPAVPSVPSPTVFFPVRPQAEAAAREALRKEAVARYLSKRRKRDAGSKRPVRKPGQKLRERRQKYASRQSIAHHRPRVWGRFVKTSARIEAEEGTMSKKVSANSDM